MSAENPECEEEAQDESVKRPYVKPMLLDEEVFEREALQVGTNGVGFCAPPPSTS